MFRNRKMLISTGVLLLLCAALRLGRFITLVPKVDFISAPGTSPPEIYRPGGPYALITGRAVFRFDRDSARFALQSVHPGETVTGVTDATGFGFDQAANVPDTEAPDAQALALIRGAVGEAIAETYPHFAETRLRRAA